MSNASGSTRLKDASKLLLLVVFLAGVCMPGFGEAFTLHVEDELGAAIVGGYRYLVEEDTTHPVDTVNDPVTHPVDTLSVSIHRSYAPVVTKGNVPGGGDIVINTDISGAPLDVNKRYVVSVLSLDGGYTMSSANVPANPVNPVNVVLVNHPIPTARISVFVFHDHSPINNEPNAPFEVGLENFQVLLFDFGGQVTQDAFGNPLGTTYDGGGNPVAIGTGDIHTDANGEALIDNIPPGKYGVRIVPCIPNGSTCPGEIGKIWNQTNTIEGTPGIDAWVRSGEPVRLVEFGPALHHTFFGFVQATNELATLPNPGGLTGAITGRVVKMHSSRPPAIQINPGNPLEDCWVGLNVLGAGTNTGVYAAPCNPDSTFAIGNVPPGTYQIVVWDTPLVSIFYFQTVIVPDTGGTIAIGDIAPPQWFGIIQGTVFYDSDQDGFYDPGEVGIPNQAVGLRFRDGSVYQGTVTDPLGKYELPEVFPFFKYLVAEIDFLSRKATGATFVVDNGGPLSPLPIYPFDTVNTPQPQPENAGAGWRTETGPVLLEAITTYADQVNVLNWGKADYGPGENGGISGIVFYATTRAEDDPRYAAGEPWEPGIPRVQVNLYQDNLNNTSGLPGADGKIDNINGTPGIQLADVDNYPFGWADGGAMGTEDRRRAGNTACVATLSCVFDLGDALEIATTDSWDDNLPTGCVGPTEYVNGQPIVDCAETLRTWNQVRPAVFDGGYAFGAAPPYLPSGTYIVEAVPPPGYETVKEEDRNVDFGDEYVPNPAVLPPICVGNLHTVDSTQALFPGFVSPYEGMNRPLCDQKQISLTDGLNPGVEFFMFTEVPKAARGVGLVNNDLAIVFNPNSPIFTEKSTASWLPISFQDFLGNEVARVFTDEFGAYNALVPSTYTVNAASPSGVSPGMLQVCLNHPLLPNGDPEPNFDPRFSQTCYTLDFWPGRTTYLDTPVIPISAFTAAVNSTLDCQLPDGTPVIRMANDTNDGTGATGNGPYVPATGNDIWIYSAGTVNVPNPDFDPFIGVGSPTVPRDFGFGAAQGSGSVTINSINASVVSWADDVIQVTVPGGAATGQVVVTRDNGKPSVLGITVHVGGPAPTIIQPGVLGTTPIQDAIDAAAAEDLIMLRPGNYAENVIMYKKIRLQGFGAWGTTINAAPFPTTKRTVWRDNLNNLITGGMVGLVPGQDATFIAEEGPGILVIPPNGDFVQANHAMIDGIGVISAMQGSGVFVNGYSHYLEIGNMRLLNNNGTGGGGIRVGHAGLLPSALGYQSSENTNLNIHNNLVLLNGGSGPNSGGGITLFNGSDNYSITENFICGNFTTQSGGGIAHFGLSDNGLIADNWITLNEATFGSLSGGSGGGIMIKGEPAPAGAPGNLSFGTGSVTIDGNLLQANLAGSNFGGGLYASFVNGQDVLASPNNSTSWYSVEAFNNMIVNNIAGTAGAGFYGEDMAKAFLVHNTFAHNDSLGTGAAAFTGQNPACVGTLPNSCSDPQGAGVVTGLHSGGLQGTIGIGAGPEFTATYSNPLLYNNIFWENRSFYWDNRQVTNGLGGLVFSDHIDLQVYGVIPAPLLAPMSSVITDTLGYDLSNSQGNPNFVGPYFNNAFVAVETAEGGNFISPVFAPLTLTGNYHIQGGSSAINLGAAINNPPLSPFPELSSDFDRQTRPNGGEDSGADESYGGVTLFTITSSPGANGTISPLGAVGVAQGTSQTFLMIPNVGYHVASVLVDGAPVAGAPTSYTFMNVQAGHTISATFAQNEYTVIPSADANGTISPNTPQLIIHGGSVAFTIAPNPGYRISDVLVDGNTVCAPNCQTQTSYTFTNVTSNHEIHATFVTDTYSIVTSVSPGGTISPAGVTVTPGSNQLFTITPLPGYRIVDVVVDGVSQGPVPTYSFNNIQANHTMSASFVIVGRFLLAASATPGGTITPSGFLALLPGATQTFFMAPSDGFVIADVLVDGASVGTPASYQFPNLTADHSIHAVFLTPTAKVIYDYYKDILGRFPEPGGVEFWTAEVERIIGLGIDIREGFISAAKGFFTSGEYLAKGTSDVQYVTDLYRSYLRRAPEQAGLDFWVSYLAQGVPRSIILNAFGFSEEFGLYIDGVVGIAVTRPENNMVNDFYRAFLGRLPDTAGFNLWLGLMRTAQCAGPQQVRDLAHQLALGFIQSAEYALRARTDTEFVGDLYGGILRRTAAPAEVSHWLGAIGGGATREEILGFFTNSVEFQTRVQAVIDAGCL